MTKRKWGESFLKSGLPLEHLTAVTFGTLGWQIDSNIEYVRKNQNGVDTWFQIDLFVTSMDENKDTELSFLVECKYHDASRFWMFLPHKGQGRWEFDDRVLNCGPVQTLRFPKKNILLKIATLSTWGVVISRDGTKQDNAIQTAVQQLANAFVPLSVERVFQYNLDVQGINSVPWVTATIPMIVTNASIFRLKPDVSDLDMIRAASSPAEIADELEWTWCYYDPPNAVIDTNMKDIDAHFQKGYGLLRRFPTVDDRLNNFMDRPNWVAIVNIRSLVSTVKTISATFGKIETEMVKSIIKRSLRKIEKESRFD